MRYILIACVLLAGCSGSPTAPSAPVASNPAATIPPVATTPVATVPPVVVPPVTPPNPLLQDPRFDLNFYRQFALGGLNIPLSRLTQAPRFYIRTVDEAGRPIDAFTLNETSAALLNTTSAWAGGAFGAAGLEQGTGTREGQPGWVTVRWAAHSDPRFCGDVSSGQSDRRELITLYPQTPGCRCAGGPAVRLKTVKHELGHVLGYYHTDNPSDLMFPGGSACDLNPSAREVFHARVAYSQPVGSTDPR